MFDAKLSDRAFVVAGQRDKGIEPIFTILSMYWCHGLILLNIVNYVKWSKKIMTRRSPFQNYVPTINCRLNPVEDFVSNIYVESNSYVNSMKY